MGEVCGVKLGPNAKGDFCQNSVKNEYGACGMKTHILKKRGVVADKPTYVFKADGRFLEPMKSQEAKLDAVIKKGPGDTDCFGYIYMYYNKSEGRSSEYRKIGKTDRTVKERMKEWPDGVLDKSYTVKRCQFAETVIFAYLNHVRVHRVKHKDRYLSEWVDRACKLKYIGDVDFAILARDVAFGTTPLKTFATKNDLKRRIEWFVGESDYFDRVCRAVVSGVNAMFKDEPFPPDALGVGL